mmetsp:Transcript_26862/g.81000  ORF Transcript_26862/g.81000 Transcript_26862/m.81000 type:complete len:295 (+) Transcript_26862:90-974(+)
MGRRNRLGQRAGRGGVLRAGAQPHCDMQAEGGHDNNVAPFRAARRGRGDPEHGGVDRGGGLPGGPHLRRRHGGRLRRCVGTAQHRLHRLLLRRARVEVSRGRVLRPLLLQWLARQLEHPRHRGLLHEPLGDSLHLPQASQHRPQARRIHRIRYSDRMLVPGDAAAADIQVLPEASLNSVWSPRRYGLRRVDHLVCADCVGPVRYHVHAVDRSPSRALRQRRTNVDDLLRDRRKVDVHIVPVLDIGRLELRDHDSREIHAVDVHRLDRVCRLHGFHLGLPVHREHGQSHDQDEGG